MAVALKNDGRQASKLIGAFDFAIVEQCFQYHECGYYRTFVRARQGGLRGRVRTRARPVLRRRRGRLDFSAIRKSYDLFARPWRPCPG